MAELEESIHSYFWTLQTKRFFLDAQTFIVVITLRRQPWPAHMVTMPFSRHGKSTTNAQEESGQHRANKRLNTSPQNPIKNKLYHKVTFSTFLLYEVSSAGGCLADSILQDEYKRAAQGCPFSEQMEGPVGALPCISDKRMYVQVWVVVDRLQFHIEIMS